MLPIKYTHKVALFLFYFLFISVLFFLPGSAFPKEDWLSKIYFDKWVHIGLFTILSFLACWTFLLESRKSLWLLLLGTIVYGLLVEIIQFYLVSNRSYDLGDLLADIVGSSMGIWFWKGWYLKK
jgi:VanZ family protein